LSLGLPHVPSLKVDSILASFLKFTPTHKAHSNGDMKAQEGAGRPKPLLEDVANHDAFVTLLEVIETARNRKRDLLSLIEDANNLALAGKSNDVNGDVSKHVVSETTREHMSWVRDNLDRTDLILQTATNFLRTLYSDSALRSKRSRKKRDDSEGRFDFVEKCFGTLEPAGYCAKPMAKDWTVNLIAHSQDIGSAIASKIMAPSRTSRQSLARLGDSSVALRGRVTATSELLCTLSYAMSITDGPVAAEAFTAMAIAADKMSADMFPRDDRSRSNQLYNEVVDARDAAVAELTETLDLFKAELELSAMKHSLEHPKERR
jgi:hypothetical protein